jgi:hypothetical protein
MQEIGVLHVPAAITPEIIITNSEQLKQRKWSLGKNIPGAQNVRLVNTHVIFQNFAVNTVS